MVAVAVGLPLLSALGVSPVAKAFPTEVRVEEQDSEAQEEKPPSISQLYPLLFPYGADETLTVVAASEAAVTDVPEQGFWLGALNIRPAVNLRYIDSDSVFIEDPTPTRVRYLEVEPVLAGLLAPGSSDGRLSFRYAPRFRTGASEDVVNSTTHIFDAGVDYPISASSSLSGGYRYVDGTLETREVDPGGEFFFGLQPFTRHRLFGSSDVAIGAVWGVGVGADWNWVDIDEEQAGFYSHERGSANGNLWYDVNPTMRARVGYRYDRVPPPATRPIAESSAHTAFVAVDGELSPATRATVSLGYRDQTNPNIAGPGSSFGGVTYEGRIRRDISWSSSLTLAVFRAPLPSAFQDNGFYTTTGLGLSARFQLPLEVSAIGSIEYRRNGYERDTLIPDDDGNIVDVGDPRRDDLFGWSVGLGRALTRWGFIRADYRETKRDSNVPNFRNDTGAFVLQVGFGYFGSGQP